MTEMSFSLQWKQNQKCHSRSKNNVLVGTKNETQWPDGQKPEQYVGHGRNSNNVMETAGATTALQCQKQKQHGQTNGSENNLLSVTQVAVM